MIRSDHRETNITARYCFGSSFWYSLALSRTTLSVLAMLKDPEPLFLSFTLAGQRWQNRENTSAPDTAITETLVPVPVNQDPILEPNVPWDKIAVSTSVSSAIWSGPPNGAAMLKSWPDHGNHCVPSYRSTRRYKDVLNPGCASLCFITPVRYISLYRPHPNHSFQISFILNIQ
jgi:hypothetical protein